MLLLRTNGLRLYVRGRRVHHGLTGLVMALFGAALLFHDRRDFPFRFNDGFPHERR